MLKKTYGNTEVKRVEEGLWRATHTLREGDEDRSASYVMCSSDTEEMAMLRLVELLGYLLRKEGYRGVSHG